MRVLFVINSLDAVGGAEKVAVTLAAALKQIYSYEIHIAYICEEKSASHPQVHQAVYLPLKAQLEAQKIQYTWLGKRPGSGWRGARQVYKCLQEVTQKFKPDIVHSHCFHPDMYSYLQKGKHQRIRTLHLDLYYRNKRTDILIEKVMQKSFVQNIFLCPSLLKYWKDTHQISPDRCTEIPNPVSDCFFTNVSARVTAPRPPYKVGIVGRLTKQKGHMYAIQALAKLAEEGLRTKLYIVGGGALYEKLRAIAKQHTNLEITFMGSMLEAQVRRLYDKLDLLLVPSLYEGFNLTTYEALATGLPVVGTKVCGVEDILTAIGAKSVATANHVALSCAIRSLLEDEVQYLALSKQGIEKTKKCQIRKVAEAHHTCYMSLQRQVTRET